MLDWSSKNKQTVTLESDGREVEQDISPHLTIWTAMDLEEDLNEYIKAKIVELQQVYDWVHRVCHS